MEYPILPPPRYFHTLSQKDQVRAKVIMLTRQINAIMLLLKTPPPADAGEEYFQACNKAFDKLPDLINHLLAAPVGLDKC
jgi:hypothetical protein